MSTKLKNLFFVIGFAFLAVISGCKDDDPEPQNEEELITTMTLTLTPHGGGTPAVFQFRDLDGDGGDAPVITGDPLSDSTMYHATIELLNEAESPAENITDEVKEENLEHQFFFQPSSVLNVNFSYTDTDDEGNPIGVTTDCNTGSASTGTLKVTLRHQPDKNGSGVPGGDITNAGGDTDIEVMFDVVIE